MQVISEWDVYLITRFDYVQGFFIGLAVFISLAAAVTGLIALFNLDLSGCEHLVARGSSLFKKLAPAAVLCIFFACLIPDTKEFAAIKVIPAVANNENMQGIGKELVDLGKQWLVELRPEQK